MAVVKSVSGVDDSAHAANSGSLDVEKTVEDFDVNVDEEQLRKPSPQQLIVCEYVACVVVCVNGRDQ